ncbi:MAG: hydroxyacid dehydrogenase [Ruminococcaceae bacterium]|jgi:phosphoglycerate dehydrogenase-like enzyme|nr:hydroxyacid dehydrogenase [Oscillospiraceae bacterium]
MKNAVFFGDGRRIGDVYAHETVEKLRAAYCFETDRVLSKGEMDAYRDVLARADYLFTTWGMPHFEREEIREYLPNLKAVYYGAGSVQYFAREFLAEGVAVFSAWAANGVPVAEYAFSEIVLASKGFFQRLHVAADGSGWPNRSLPVVFPGNYEIKVGIIGAGMIGKMVIERLKSLDKIKILVFDPFLPDEKAAQLGVEKTDLKTLFRECDVISNHLANNPQTVGILTGERFASMKPHAVFINTGRGAQVCEDGMIEALRAVPTRAAVLDVTFPEPPEKDSPLYTLPNVFLTPHIAGSIGNEVHRMAEYMFEESVSFDAGLPTRYRVTEKMLETMA